MKTRFVLLITLFYLFNFSTYSQDSVASKEFRHIVKISPLGFVTKARVAYEYILPGKQGRWTVGLIGTLHYDSDYSGLVIEPIARYYLDGNTRGFYFQGKATVGRVRSTVYYPDATESFYDSTGAFTGKYSVFYPYKSRHLTTLGGSLAFGYQFFLSKNKRWLMDFNIGIQYAVYLNNSDFSETLYFSNGGKRITEYSNGKVYPYFDAGPPYFYEYFNPGSRLTSNLFIGYRF